MIPFNKAIQTGKYKYTMCDFCQNSGTCLYVCFCYQCAKCSLNAKARNEPMTISHCFQCSYYARANIKHARGMEYNLCSDCLAYLCCPCCAMIQDLNEIDEIKKDMENELEKIPHDESSSSSKPKPPQVQQGYPPAQPYPGAPQYYQQPPPNAYPAPNGYIPQNAYPAPNGYPPQNAYPAPQYGNPPQNAYPAPQYGNPT